jgi:hypothetical protein
MKRSRPSAPAGELLRCRRTLQIGEATIDGMGLLPRVIVTLRANGKDTRAFREHCRRLAVSVVPCQWLHPDEHGDDEWQGRPFVFDVAGTLPQLEAVAALPNVDHVHNAISVRIGQIASGTGDEKIKGSGKVKHKPLPTPVDPGRFEGFSEQWRKDHS